MRTRLLTFLLALCLAVPALAGPLAVVVRTKGEVWLEQGKARAAARSGDLLPEGAKLTTGSDGRVLLRFLADQSIAEVKPGSVVQLGLRTREDGTVLRRVFLHAGDAAFGVTPGKGRDLRFESATTVASVRGTQFSLQVQGGKTRVGVSEGVVRVCHSALGKTVHVPAGSSVLVTEDDLGIETGTAAPDADSAHALSVRHRFAVDFQGASARKGLRFDWDSAATAAPSVRRYDPALFQLVNP